jgi:amino acid transporter
MNVLAVRIYGESEFWLSGGKIFLIFILFAFTFVTMVGGNPKGDAYGFRYWNKPGSFAEHLGSGSLGRFEGFLAALWTASFTCVGPEYVSIVAAEAKHPRIYIKNAFKTMYWRFGIFFIGSALCCGIVIAYNDPTLVAIYSGASGGSGTASACPYVIAMKNLGISVLPHIVNAILLTSIFSAGNTYTYCATRTLYGLALEGRAPKFFTKCWRNGVPIYCFIAVIAFSALSFLQVSNNSATVLSWLVNLVTASGLITYIVMCVTYICFYRACKAQGLDRSTLPYKGWFQPWCGYIGLVWMILVVGSYGYSSFMPWDVDTFLTYYMMVFVSIVLFVGWKLIKRTKFLGPKEIDLIWEAPIVTAYEEIMSVQEPPVGFWAEIFQVVNIRKLKSDKQETSKA